MCGSTCFGRLPAHHQEHTTVPEASGFTVGGKRLERCWSWSGRPRPTTRTNNMGGEAPETCWATRKRQVINLWNYCILLVDLFESYDDAGTYERQKTTGNVWQHSNFLVNVSELVFFHAFTTTRTKIQLWRHYYHPMSTNIRNASKDNRENTSGRDNGK